MANPGMEELLKLTDNTNAKRIYAMIRNEGIAHLRKHAVAERVDDVKLLCDRALADDSETLVDLLAERARTR